MKKEFFGYIRVSTVRQGEHGVSLQEQRDAIQRYAERYEAVIIQWFEERETAAKRGRPIFTTMMQLLRQGKVRGVILHKIDRGARNLKDWSDIGDLIDVGVEVHFANESVDLQTRGGRLSADIQAVVAADYIRNLREESRKGFYGRLKQGLYPIGAPIGYRNCGGGQPKEHDPVMAPLVLRAFQLYATGEYSLPRLVDEMYARGLRSHRGGRVTLNGLSTVLNNPFYIGLIRIKKTGEMFPGVHQPIVATQLFDRVKTILKGKTVTRQAKHDFAFRRLLTCICNYSLIAERQKGHVYYRCQTPNCEMTTIREERIDEAFSSAFRNLEISDQEMRYVQNWFAKSERDQETLNRAVVENCKLQLDQIRTRMNRLTDAYIDGALERIAFEERKASLLLEEAGLRDKLQSAEAGYDRTLIQMQKFLELVKNASDTYKLATAEEKRILVKEITSNRTVQGKNIVVVLKPEHQLIATRGSPSLGRAQRGVPRTWHRILNKLFHFLKGHPEISADADPD